MPHPSQERKLDKERGDILTWEPEHKKGRTTSQEPKKYIIKDIICVKIEESKRQMWYDFIVQRGKNKMHQDGGGDSGCGLGKVSGGQV